MRRNKGGGGLIPSPFTYAIRRLNEVPYEVLRGGTKVLGEGSTERLGAGGVPRKRDSCLRPKKLLGGGGRLPCPSTLRRRFLKILPENP